MEITQLKPTPNCRLANNFLRAQNSVSNEKKKILQLSAKFNSPHFKKHHKIVMKIFADAHIIHPILRIINYDGIKQ
jgi:hypothetical protein